MPELFGSAYILPAIIVVVLLLILFLALMRSRRTRASKSERLASGRDPARPDAVAGEPAEVGSTSEVVTEAEPGLAAATRAGTRARQNAPRFGQHAQRWEAAMPSAAAATAADPVTPVLMELLHGWGDLSREDKNRLDVFKPEVVQAAARGLQMPKGLKNDQDARVRLDQLVRYADDMAAGHAVPAVPEPLGSAPESSDDDGAIIAGAAPAGAAALAAALAETTQEVRLVPPPGGDVSTDGADEAVASVDVDTGGAAGDLETTQIVGAAAAGAGGLISMTGTRQKTSSTEQTAGEGEGLDAFVDSRAGRVAPELGKADMPQVPQTADAAPESSSLDLAFGQWEEAAPPALEEVSTFGEWSPLDDTLETPPKPRPLLGGVVRTADDLLTLPADEQADMVAFLEPGELAGVLKRTDDPALKKAVIDTLEHVNSPAALEVLRQCLDDTDPEVQMYALQAADRILGSR